MAVKCRRRAATNSSPSSGSSVAKTSLAPDTSQAAIATATSSARAAPGASDWMRRSAPASRSRPIARKSSTALIEAWSISSTSEARTVRPSSMTAAAAAATVGNVATTVDTGGWAGTSRSVARVTMPRVPSEPTNSLSSGSPATSLTRLPPRLTRVPSASTTSRPST